MSKEISNFLTLKDVINSLVEYDIKHCPFPQNDNSKGIDQGGMIDDEKKIIYIEDEQTYKSKRTVLIHELLHAKYFRLGKEDNEEQIEKETDIIYKKLYG
ncbi:hypothetical protein M0R19_00895 [Candidatus Pacearchaeota archaeon]|jgi:Zn-dependent peptidase ImmA (M78 family)|nr:hypothetical protein [Candidatus Pacearchaeota archaeon]